LKRNLTFIAFVIAALLTWSVAIPPSEAHRDFLTSSGEIPRQAESFQNAGHGFNPQMRDQNTQTVSGQTTSHKPQDPELAKVLRDYDLIRLNPRAAAAQIRNTGRLLILTSEGDFDMQLAPYDMRAPDYASQLITADGMAHKLAKGPINTYKGTVKGDSGAQARMSVKESTIEGAIITRSDRFFLQPARSLSKIARDDEFVFYRSSDVANEGATCGVTLADEVAAQEARTGSHLKAGETTGATGPITGLSPLKIARIATDADAEYVSAFGGASQANAQIASIMNLVDGIYQVEIGITFQIVFQNTWADAATDPYTSTAPGTRLDEFRNHWNANFTGVQRSLAHLWTGIDLDGGTIGVASLAVVCRTPQRAYGLSQKFPLSGTSITASTVVLTAHEIGHNFSAFHTNPSGPDPVVPPDMQQPCQLTIMEASIGPGSSFCPFSRSQIVGHANANSSCLLDSSVSAPSPSCSETAMSNGVSINGTISSSDCPAPSRGVGHFADRYSFNGTAGQQVRILMTQSSGNLAPYLYLIGPDGYVVTQIGFSGGTAAAIGGILTDGFTLPLTGKYFIEATSFGSDQTGNYTITLTFNGCTLSVSPTSQHFPAIGASGTINVTPSGVCGSYQFVEHPGSATWLSVQTTGGSGARSLGFNVQPNTNAAGRRGFLLIAPSPNFGGHAFGGLRIPITQSGTGPDCALTPIISGQTTNGDLSTTDCQSPVKGNGFFTDRYVFNAFAGQQVAINLSSPSAPEPDTFLTLIGPNGAVILTDDDSGGFTNSRIPGGPGFLTLGLPGTYIIEVGTFESGQTGSYTLTLTSGSSSSSSVSFESADLAVSEGTDANGIGFEGTGFRTITVQRSGDVSGAASVDYVTSNGSAVSGKDYAQSLGTLRFAPNETTKTFVVFIIDDVFQEPPETVNLFLTNPVATTLGSTPTAVLTINSNDATTGANPVDANSFNTGFFVRQHYIDFFTREPDLSGLNFWKNQIDECTDEACREVRRINVSGAFFLSIEFQQTGYVVYRTFTTAFGPTRVGGTVPLTLTEFLPDVQRIGQGVVIGQPGADALLEANKQAYFNEFVTRPQFVAQYPLSMLPAQFVDALNANVGGALSQSERDALVADLVSGAKTRAQVLRAVAEDQDLINAHFNRAFVLMQYFGYLRRNPNDPPEATLDFQGYNFWLNKLNQFNGNFVHAEMVKSFIISGEYRQRFGP
jgi:hypothetical protein